MSLKKADSRQCKTTAGSVFSNLGSLLCEEVKRKEREIIHKRARRYHLLVSHFCHAVSRRAC